MEALKLRKESIEALSAQLTGLLREQFSLRMQHAMDQVTQTHAIKRVRRDIARVRTIIAEKKKLLENGFVQSEGEER